jgi:hypothetical protein
MARPKDREKPRVPRLFWLVYGESPSITLFIQPAETMVFAQLKASIAGMEGKCKEIYALDAKMARKVPKKLIGKALNQKQANALVKKLR